MKTLAFDLDGVLLNTLGDLAATCDVIMERHGFAPHPLDSYRMRVGQGFEKLVSLALPGDVYVSPEKLAAMVEEAKEYYSMHMMDRTKPYPGMAASLAALAEAGVRLAVLSNKVDRFTKALIGRYYPEIPFAAVVGARPGVPLKPDPAALILLLESLGAEKAETAYVGDSGLDMVTARGAGVAGIGAAWGFRGGRELEEAGATVVIDRPEDLPKALESLGKK